ncbi:hypothetical protein DVH05_006512 [Phytophthora capsici]|nr:hypothetical protein DVH05_006512 [Phytophthora capsici]
MTAAPIEVSAVSSRRAGLYAAGHAFTRYNQSATRTSYRCKAYRRAKCKAKLHFIHKDNEYEFQGEHTCHHGRRAILPPGLDVTEAMKDATDTTTLTRMDLTVERIWKKLREDFYPEELSLVQFGLTREQVTQRVHRAR